LLGCLVAAAAVTLAEKQRQHGHGCVAEALAVEKGANEEFLLTVRAAVAVTGFLMSPDFCALVGVTENGNAAI